jgi:predicted outer membrane repeat protein
MDKGYQRIAIAGVLSGLCFVSQSANAHENVIRVKASTTAEIIAAINAANGSGIPTIIRVSPGQYHFTTPFDSGASPSLLPPITGNVTVIGRSADTTSFARQNTFGRFFTVLAGGSLHITRLTLSGGMTECVVEECGLDSGGGAAASFGGDLWIKECVLTQNIAVGFDGNGSTAGGAVLSRDGILHIENSDLTNNFAIGAGGGVALIRGSGTIKRSRISGGGVWIGPANGGNVFGGGIWVAEAQLDIAHSTISGNKAGAEFDEWAGFGAGIANSGGTVSIVKSAIVENVAVALGVGAGLYNAQGTMTVQDSTVAGNSAGTSGGGIYNAGVLQLEGVTVARNDSQNNISPGGASGLREFPNGCRVDDNLEGCITGGGGIWIEGAGTVQSVRSVIGSNTLSFDDSRQFGPDCRGALTSGGYTALGDSTDCSLVRAPGLPPHSADKVDIDPLLGELQDNGDAGYPHLPVLAGSPLIDAGGRVSRLCAPRDQIGQPRVDGNGDGTALCDIGAIEYQP